MGWRMNVHLKLAYDLGVQTAREKFAQGTSIRQQRQAPTWGLGGPLPSGFKEPPPPPLQRKPMTTQGLPPKSPIRTSTAPTGQAGGTNTSGASSAQIGSPQATGGTTGVSHNTAAGVSGKQHAWNQQAGRMSAGKAQANIAADQTVANVVSRGNREMGDVLRDTSGNPGAPPALTGAQMPGSQVSR